MNSTGHRIVRAFLAGDTAAVVDRLAPDATFHSPVTDYRGRDRIAKVLQALPQVVTGLRLTRRLDGPGETAAFFTADVRDDQVEGMLLVLAAPGAPATDLTLMIRPLETLLLGIEQMKQILDSGKRRAGRERPGLDI